MKIHNKKLLEDFRDSHADAQTQIDSWVVITQAATWQTPAELRQQFPTARFVKGNHVIFKICGNKYRLWVLATFKHGIILIKNIGNHNEYDRWDIGK
jgi:mRNA interferase HigB